MNENIFIKIAKEFGMQKMIKQSDRQHPSVTQRKVFWIFEALIWRSITVTLPTVGKNSRLNIHTETMMNRYVKLWLRLKHWMRNKSQTSIQYLWLVLAVVLLLVLLLLSFLRKEEKQVSPSILLQPQTGYHMWMEHGGQAWSQSVSISNSISHIIDASLNVFYSVSVS